MNRSKQFSLKLYYLQCKQFQPVVSILFLVRIDEQFSSGAVEIFFSGKDD